ncbi:hypothetical protein [Psychromonas sp. Urea-02u-13]|uniref:hypothetical protein n=1 Tax=Psychromonas sp. Urea-02u-13 TaxID=2058326 RepID=UPI0012FF4445|nr:hypothetical protein [Psychromonas sp. Urea-02u-13]
MNIDMNFVKTQPQGIVLIKQSQETEERIAKTEEKKESDKAQGVKVSLSAEGKQKQEDEVNGTDKNSGSSVVDGVIARLKEQIEQLKKQIEALQGNDSPEAKEQRKMFNEQLGMLNAALLSAINKMTEGDQKKQTRS